MSETDEYTRQWIEAHELAASAVARFAFDTTMAVEARDKDAPVFSEMSLMVLVKYANALREEIMTRVAMAGEKQRIEVALSLETRAADEAASWVALCMAETERMMGEGNVH